MCKEQKLVSYIQDKECFRYDPCVIYCIQPVMGFVKKKKTNKQSLCPLDLKNENLKGEDSDFQNSARIHFFFYT